MQASTFMQRQSAPHMKNILVALEISTAEAPVIAQATALAHAFGARLWLIHAAAPAPDFVGYEAGPQYIRDVRADELRHEHTELQRWRGELATAGLEVEALLVQGPTVETILAEAERLKADIIVMGSHGKRGLRKAFLGSVSEDVLRENKLPLLVVPTPEHVDH
jgi:nucleotide-binding universal stress UspA family protein